MKWKWISHKQAFFFLLPFIAGQAFAQTVTASLDSLTLERAIALAVQHHPVLRAAEASAEAAGATLKQARSSYFPSLNLAASTTRTEGAFVFNPSFPPRDQKYTNYSASLALQQTLYDFGKTSGRVSASANLREASRFDYQSAANNVIANVQLAYLNYLQAGQVVKVNEATVAQTEQHLVQARAFHSVGKRPQFDVTKSEVDVANAKVDLIRSRNQARLAKVQLENAMGVHPNTSYSVSESFTIAPFAASLDSAQAWAQNARPDLRSARARFYANEALVAATWRQHLPTLSLSGNYIWSAFDFPLFSRWNAGVTLSLPLFQGFNVSAQVQQARANEALTRASIDVLIESVRLEVEQSYLEMKEAEERIGATAKLVELSQETLKLAQARYNSGVGSAIEITDAQVTLSNAQITHIQARYDFNRGLVRLRRATGVIEVQR
jgi:TolC family type I secretion outer membrane protein